MTLTPVEGSPSDAIRQVRTITAYKGFDKDLRCRGYQYAVGETYTHDGNARLCDAGFHACTLPLDVLRYYPLAGGNRYHRVELDDATPSADGDSKRAARKISIGASLNLMGLVEAHVEAIWDTVKPVVDKAGAGSAHSATTGDSANSATTGYSAHSATTGDSAHSATTGRYANSATTGSSANSATTGDSAHSATTGRYANSATTGYSAGVRCSVADPTAVAAVHGEGAARGAVGSWLVLTERDDECNVVEVRAVQVDGETLKPHTYYRLTGGQLVEVDQ